MSPSAARATPARVTVTLRPLAEADVDAHRAGEDEATVRWLSGGPSSGDETRAHFALLAANLAAGVGKRGFGVCVDGRLAGYVDVDPDIVDGLSRGDVNVSFATHPWARHRGLAVRAVELICDYLRDERIGSAVALRIAIDNTASIRVAEKSGFTVVREFVSETDTDAAGRPLVMPLPAPPLVPVGHVRSGVRGLPLGLFTGSHGDAASAAEVSRTARPPPPRPSSGASSPSSSWSPTGATG